MNLSHVSASSIELYRACPRKWYYRYILKHTSQATEAMLLGTKVHAVLEEYLLNGTTPAGRAKAALIAAPGIKLLPARNPKTQRVEAPLSDFKIEGLPVPFKGFIDLLDLTDGVHILDHKTTSDLTKWPKTEEELAVNTQLIIYARHVLEHYPQAKEARLTHIYYQTKTPYAAKSVSVSVTREDVYERFKEILTIAESMVEAASNSLDSTAKESGYCYSYGKRCDHYNECHYTIEHIERLPMTDNQEDILAYLRGDVEEEETPAPQAEEETPALKAETQETTLYIGCRPINEEVTALRTALAPYIDAICAQEGVEHISYIKYAQGYDYLNAMIEQRGLPPGAIYADPNSALYNRLVDALLLKATRVVMRS
jgi:RecB family exonuclease